MISVDSFERLHVFYVERREEFMKLIAEYAMKFVGVNICFKDKLSEESVLQRRFGRFSSDEAVTSLSDFMVHKMSARHRVRS